MPRVRHLQSGPVIPAAERVIFSGTGTTGAGYRSINRLCALLDGRAHFVAPFRPRTVIVADVIQA
jgi:hypothetical protein